MKNVTAVRAALGAGVGFNIPINLQDEIKYSGVSE
jgi:hypothetical protein